MREQHRLSKKLNLLTPQYSVTQMGDKLTKMKKHNNSIKCFSKVLVHYVGQKSLMTLKAIICESLFVYLACYSVIHRDCISCISILFVITWSNVV